jgi:hypothetical protein
MYPAYYGVVGQNSSKMSNFITIVVLLKFRFLEKAVVNEAFPKPTGFWESLEFR